MSRSSTTVDVSDLKDDVRSLAGDLREVAGVLATELAAEVNRLAADLPDRMPDLSELPATVAGHLPGPVADRIAPQRRSRGRIVAMVAAAGLVAAGGVLFARSRRQQPPMRPTAADPYGAPPAGGVSAGPA